jgi:hypothetical protein
MKQRREAKGKKSRMKMRRRRKVMHNGNSSNNKHIVKKIGAGIISLKTP